MGYPNLMSLLQVVHVERYENDSMAVLWVTDYTGHDLLLRPTAKPWARNLGDVSLKIVCYGLQFEQYSKTIQAGHCYKIKNVRIRQSGAAKIYGEIDGDHKLITKLKESGPEVIEELQRLLR